MKRKLTGEEYEKLSEELQALYKKEGDGNYYLDVDESDEIKAEKDKVKEFRTNNITLQKRVEEFERKFKDVDPEEFSKLKQKFQDIEDKKLLEEGEIDKLVEQKTERMVQDYEAQITALSDDNERLNGELLKVNERLNSEVIDSRITKSISNVGTVRKGAMEDIVSRGRRTWKLADDGEPIATKADGTPLYGKDPKKPLSFDEWAEGLVTDAPYLFEPSEGLHSRGGPGGPTSKSGLPKDWENLPATERLKLAHNHNSKQAT